MANSLFVIVFSYLCALKSNKGGAPVTIGGNKPPYFRAYSACKMK